MPKEKSIIEKVFAPSKKQSAAVLLTFQNGELRTSHKDTTLYCPLKSSEDNQKRAMVITSGNVYTGKVNEGLATELTDNYICVRNKLTNKVRILPIDQVKLQNNLYQEKKKITFNIMSKEDSYAVAMRNFGGRKDMRFLNHKMRNEMNIDVVQDQLENTVEKSEILETTEPVVSAESNVSRIRPEFNKEAKTLDTIFNLYDIIPLELINRLDEEANVVYSTEIDDIPIPSEYLKNIIISIKKGPQSTQSLLKIKIIIYMDALQKLITTKAARLTKLEMSQITEKVENDVRNRFGDRGMVNNLRTSFSNEKGVCYYLVLAFLISDKYELDINELSKELCMSKVKIMKIAHLINGTLKRASNTLTLRLPSKVKPMSSGFVRKRT